MWNWTRRKVRARKTCGSEPGCFTTNCCAPVGWNRGGRAWMNITRSSRHSCDRCCGCCGSSPRKPGGTQGLRSDFEQHLPVALGGRCFRPHQAHAGGFPRHRQRPARPRGACDRATARGRNAGLVLRAAATPQRIRRGNAASVLHRNLRGRTHGLLRHATSRRIVAATERGPQCGRWSTRKSFRKGSAGSGAGGPSAHVSKCRSGRNKDTFRRLPRGALGC